MMIGHIPLLGGWSASGWGLLREPSRFGNNGCRGGGIELQQNSKHNIFCQIKLTLQTNRDAQIIQKRVNVLDRNLETKLI